MMIETIPALMRDAARRYGERKALLAPGIAATSFVALDRLSDRFAKALIAARLPPGRRVAIWAPNMCEWVAAAIGTQRAGGAIVPLYFRLGAIEVADILERARADYVVCTAALATTLRSEPLPQVRRIVVGQLDGNSSSEAEVSWEAFLAEGDGVPDETAAEREAGVTGDSISDVMFTSGTTGRPKGAVFTHRSSMLSGRIMARFNQATEVDRFCPMGTFAHVGGYKQGWLTGLATGATVCWGDALDPASALELITGLGVTIMPAAPITWQGVLDYPELHRYDLSSLRFAATGGTMIPTELVRRLANELGVRQVGTGYGMTEVCGLATYTRPDDPPDKVANTVGRPAPDVEIRIVDAEGRVIDPGNEGEILIRSPRTLLEYLDDPVATSSAISVDGWYHSGDVGSLDSEGYLRITDRLKDMYIINGLNVYPAEIERLVGTIAGVEQCAVIGTPDPRKGEVGVAFIVRAAGSQLTEGDVVAWCRSNFAGYKVPASVNFVDDLPRNAMGKVLKNELRSSLASGGA